MPELLRKPLYDPEPVLDPIDRESMEIDDFFSMVADRQDDFDLPYYPDPEGAYYGNV